MRNARTMIFGAMLLAAPLAVAQTMPQTGPETGPQTSDGARPGNDIGTRSSLPRSPIASNITGSDTQSTIAPTPPAPDVPPGASAASLLMSANQSLASNQTGTADEALERAETNILQRGVPAVTANVPSADPVVTQIEQARQEIGNRNLQAASATINQILSSNAPELSL
jgi:hypothetical protein